MSAVAVLQNITARLGIRTVLRDVSLTINAGEVVAVVGPNGAGKSSLLKVLAGLLQTADGALTLGGTPHTALTPSHRALQLAYLPQHRAIHWPMLVRAIVGLGRLPHQATGRTTEARDTAAVDAAMAAMDVTAFADRHVLALSGGEQARVLMARALAQEPKLLLADEPTSGLDLSHQFALADVLRVRAAAGVACLVALHDLSPARILGVYGVHMQVMSVGANMIFVPQDA
jgi:iron complex transport system ATP-binding protein